MQTSRLSDRQLTGYSRSAWIAPIIGLLFVASSGMMLPGCSKTYTEEEIQALAPEIHAAAIVIDTHDDAPGGHVGEPEWSAAEYHDQETYGDDAGQWDIPRMIEGGMDATFQVVYTSQRALTPEGFEAAYERAIALFDWCHEAAGSHPDAELALTAADIRRLHENGKRAILIGVENGYPVADQLGRVTEFYDRGARYMTLSHSGDNQICASSSGRDREDYGLTDFGRQVVTEMNRLGMIIDVSHISDQAFFDVVEMSTAPVVATHSGCRALCEQGRNMTDEMLLALKENGGVIQLVLVPSFLRDSPPNPEQEAAEAALAEEFGDRESLTAEQRQQYRSRSREIRRQYPDPPVTIDDYLKHFEHAVALIGIDHVGFGSDFDGGGRIEGVGDATELPNLTVELMRRGYSRKEIEKFWGGNFLRAMEAVERAAGK
jgi:membrane dipeptidase